MTTLRTLQQRVSEWANRNFPDNTPQGTKLGVTEEIGELMEVLLLLQISDAKLSRSLLKTSQKIRQEENHDAKGRDAVGDIIIFLCHVCDMMGWSIADCVDEAWMEVEQRDWRKVVKADPEYDPIRGDKGKHNPVGFKPLSDDHSSPERPS